MSVEINNIEAIVVKPNANTLYFDGIMCDMTKIYLPEFNFSSENSLLLKMHMLLWDCDSVLSETGIAWNLEGRAAIHDRFLYANTKHQNQR